MPNDDVYELNVEGTLASQNIANVHHFVQVGSDGTGDARTALATLWDDVYSTAFLACLCDDYTLVQYRSRRIDPIETQSLVTAAAGNGALVLEPAPTQTCAILRQYAVPLLRRGTGHVKLSGIAVDHISEGRIEAALQTLMQTYGTIMESDQTESGSGYVFRSGVWSTVDSILRPIVNTKAIGRLKTVYSRQVGVGS